ncbi:MAG TPA: hypothetical protein VM434_08835 [Beijerinckiaceae bacterium]|nr:hypothetical protein [Beijerinckiaceae bacterium]
MRRSSLVLAVACLLAPVSADAQSRFDGQWSVEIVTERGDCDRAYRYAVQIRNGQVRYAGGGDFAVSGRVAQGGAVSVGIRRGRDGADARGRLSARTGAGTWTTVGSRACAGRWFAEKRG